MKYLYIALGFVFFGLGALGAMLPILPTTPFLLLASFFFLRSSRRLYQWFLGTRLYKRHLQSFVQQRALTLRTKLALLTLTTSMLAIPFFMMDNIVGRLVLVAVVAVKIWYFAFRIKTIKPQPTQQPAAEETAGQAAVQSPAAER